MSEYSFLIYPIMLGLVLFPVIGIALKKATGNEIYKPSGKIIGASMLLYFALSMLLDINSVKFLFFGTSFSLDYWNAFTHISPYYTQTRECMIPEGCPNYAGPETVWIFRMDVFVGVLIKFLLVYVVACIALDAIDKRSNQKTRAQAL